MDSPGSTRRLTPRSENALRRTWIGRRSTRRMNHSRSELVRCS